jgi:hypothetical protein
MLLIIEYLALQLPEVSLGSVKFQMFTNTTLRVLVSIVMFLINIVPTKCAVVPPVRRIGLNL